MANQYLDFELKIDASDGHVYPVSVVRSPAGEGGGQMRFPFGKLELKNHLLSLENALLRSGGQRRKTLSKDERIVRDFGGALFNALLTGDVRTLFYESQREALHKGCGLRLKLRINPPDLAALPWEFLYDGRHREYMCLSTDSPLVRYLELPQSIRPLKVAGTLRILGMIANPESATLDELDVALEKQRVENALAPLINAGQVELHWIQTPTWRGLQREMRRGPWHIFHFVGHGGFDAHQDEGVLLLEDEARQPHTLTATNLARLLADHRTLRLALLNACEGARGSTLDVFSSTAATLVQKGLPAVLAMQYEITDSAAIEFAQTFYESLADNLPVDAAVAEARKAISIAVHNSLEWGTPVVFMRAVDGRLFEVEREKAEAKDKRVSEQEGGVEIEKLGDREIASDEGASDARVDVVVGSAGDALTLSGQQVQALQEALLSAFNLSTLRMMVRMELDETLESISAESNLRFVIFDLIEWAERGGKVRELVEGARRQNSDNAHLARFAAEFELPAEQATRRSVELTAMPSVDRRDAEPEEPEVASRTVQTKVESPDSSAQEAESRSAQRTPAAESEPDKAKAPFVKSAHPKTTYPDLSTTKPPSTTIKLQPANRPWGKIILVWVGIMLLLVLGFFGVNTYQENQRRIEATATHQARLAAATATAEQLQAQATRIAPEIETAEANMIRADGAKLQPLADRFDMGFVPVPSGPFMMGNPGGIGDSDEDPQHEVVVDDFWIGKTEVTNAQYRHFIDAGGYADDRWWSEEGWAWRTEENITQPGFWDEADWNGLQQPVVRVSWYEATAYAAWLAAETKLEIRLPTEAEWEKAARGLDGRTYPWGDESPGAERLNYGQNVGKMVDVASFPDGASPYGAHDMAGNVWEWVADWYDSGYYADSMGDNPTGPETGTSRVVRGGSWFIVAGVVRAANRNRSVPDDRINDLGFRLVMSPGS